MAERILASWEAEGGAVSYSGERLLVIRDLLRSVSDAVAAEPGLHDRVRTFEERCRVMAMRLRLGV